MLSERDETEADDHDFGGPADTGDAPDPVYDSDDLGPPAEVGECRRCGEYIGRMHLDETDLCDVCRADLLMEVGPRVGPALKAATRLASLVPSPLWTNQCAADLREINALLNKLCGD